MAVYLILLKKQNLVRILAFCEDNLNKLIFAHLNINSIQSKYDSLADIIKDNINILMISETKVRNSFPDGQFFLRGFGIPFCRDLNRNGRVLCFS